MAKRKGPPAQPDHAGIKRFMVTEAGAEAARASTDDTNMNNEQGSLATIKPDFFESAISTRPTHTHTQQNLKP